MSQKVKNLTHPQLRFATRLDGILSLLFGLFLISTASGLIDVITIERKTPFYIIGGFLTAYGLIYLLIVSNQKSIGSSFIEFYNIPRALLIIVLIVDIFAGFFSTSTELKILEGAIVGSLILVIGLEFRGMSLWQQQNYAAWGFDVVGYFEDNAAIEGNPAIQYQWGDQTWFFVSEEHKKLFENDPEKYALGSDGHCSFGRNVMGLSAANANPRNWDIVDGKVYFNSTVIARAVWKAQGAKH